MPEIGTEDLAALRDQFQWSKFYLGVLVPETVHTSQINYATIPRGEVSIPFDGGAYATGFAAGSIVAGMTLWVGTTANSHDICKLRIRTPYNRTCTPRDAFSTGDGGVTGAITVCEHNYLLRDNYYLTIKEEFRLWPKHAIAVQGGIDVLRYNDYDIQYCGQNKDANRDPIVRMGPPGVAIRDGTTGLGTVRFWSNSGAAPGGGAPGSYAWTWRGGTLQSGPGAAAAGTAANPNVVTWDDTGNYLATLTLDGDVNGYRPVFIYDATGSNTPYEDFEVQNISGDFNTGGWRMSVRVKEDCKEADFPEESMIIIFAEDWYKGDQVSIGGNYEHRESNIFVGYITKESVRKDPYTDDVLFEAHTIDGEMKGCEQFPLSVEDDPNANANWLQIQNQTVDKVAYFITKWQSTLLDITDVHFSSDSKMVRWFDIAQKSLYEQLDKDCYDSAILGRCLSDRMGLVYCEKNPMHRPSLVNRDAIDTVMDIQKQDWRNEIQLPKLQTPRTSLVDLSAGYYAGGLADVELIFSLAHGDVPMERGRSVQLDNLISASQAQANRIAGNFLANQNNPYPNVRIPIGLNYRVFDIAPQEWATMSLAASDTYRGVTWTGERFIPRTVSFNLENMVGALNVDLGLEMESSGTAGVAGYYPTEPPEDDYVPPPTPVEPPWTPSVDDWEGIWVVGCCGSGAIGGTQPGILRTEDLGGATVAVPVWSAWTTGIDMGTYPFCMGMGRDPWDPKNRLFATMASKDESVLDDYISVLYRREYSGGVWGNWTVILDQAIVTSVVGTACTGVKIGRSSGNINAQGHRYVPVCARVAAWSARVTFMFKSVDNGDNWTIGSSTWVCHSALSKHRSPLGVAVGMLKGSSPYNAGQVIWLSDREFDIFGVGPPRVYASLDQGDTWQGLCVDSATHRGRRLHVDPNDQNILYVTEGYEDEDNVGRFTDPTNLAAYTTLAAWGGSQNRPPVPKIGTPNTMFSADLTVLKDSYDGGTTVNVITVDGNVAGFGFPLNWDWSKLMAGHAFQNGRDGTRYLQISPDGGTTWFNKHGNMAGNFRGLVSVGFPLDN